MNRLSYEFYRTGANNITSNLTPVLGNGEPIVGTQTINKTESVSYIRKNQLQLQLEVPVKSCS